MQRSWERYQPYRQRSILLWKCAGKILPTPSWEGHRRRSRRPWRHMHSPMSSSSATRFSSPTLTASRGCSSPTPRFPRELGCVFHMTTCSTAAVRLHTSWVRTLQRDVALALALCASQKSALFALLFVRGRSSTIAWKIDMTHKSNTLCELGGASPPSGRSPLHMTIRRRRRMCCSPRYGILGRVISLGRRKGQGRALYPGLRLGIGSTSGVSVKG
mmetsp:Transcript_17174/g.51903  ORF Transcript_17174/g.51903 Transcript_17174/m.51903 type:complete len:216 (-) Transcript_17174:514-1161(-)